jgi:polyhydroxyalkanoate synthase
MSPPPRRGPRPLPLHLGLLALRRGAALASLPLATTRPPCAPGSTPWSSGWPRSRPGQAGLARIAGQLAESGHPPEAFAAAVWRALGRADAALLAGITAYRRHPWRRDLPDPPAIWAEGGSRLLDYGTGPGPVVLFVPSLINRAQVLDLLPEASILRHMAGQGVRPLLLDWGEPGPLERGFSLTDYIAGRLERALGAAAAQGPVVLAGYCMAGLLTLAAAQRRPDRVRALALLATPWDFWAEGEAQPRAIGGLLPGLEPLLGATGALPVDAIQALFAGLDPFSIAAKYRGFAELDPASPRARRFVALEDWLNDGVALAAPVARECLGGWYGANAPARGEWRVAGEVVDPGRLRLPGFLAIPARDRIVPPATALALAGRWPGAVVHHAAAGHIGMVAGRGAEAALWQPLLRWIHDLPGQGAPVQGALVGQGGAGPHCAAAIEGGRPQS